MVSSLMRLVLYGMAALLAGTAVVGVVLRITQGLPMPIEMWLSAFVMAMLGFSAAVGGLFVPDGIELPTKTKTVPQPVIKDRQEVQSIVSTNAQVRSFHADAASDQQLILQLMEQHKKNAKITGLLVQLNDEILKSYFVELTQTNQVVKL